MYTYKAFVTKVYDGNTITCDISLGFNMILKDQKLRLYGINAPEVKGSSKEIGLKVRDLLKDRIHNKWIIIKTFKDKKEKFGRWLAEVYEPDVEESINKWLLKEGHVKSYMID